MDKSSSSWKKKLDISNISDRTHISEFKKQDAKYKIVVNANL